MGQKGAWPRSRDLLFKFWDPLISLEWLKIQTSNFACRLIVRNTKPKNEKWVKRGRDLGHVTYFSNFGTPRPNISGTAEGTKLKFSRQIDRKGY